MSVALQKRRPFNADYNTRHL